MKVCTVDIETPLIPVDGITFIDKIFCMAVKSDNGETKCFTYLWYPGSDGSIAQGLNWINQHSGGCIGHNFIGFDAPVIENIVGKITVPLIDTLILAKLMYTKDELMKMDFGIEDMPKALWGRFSLKAFGYRFNDNKIEFEQFEKLTQEMITYCKQDVDLTYKLYCHLISQPHYPSDRVIQLEYEVASIIKDSEILGFHFNMEAARALATEMKFKKMTLEHSLQKLFKPKFLPDGPVKETNNRIKNKVYLEDKNYVNKWPIPMRLVNQIKTQKNGKLKMPGKNKYKWFDKPHRLTFIVKNGEYQPIKYQKFSPGSRSQIRLWLRQDLGFEFSTYTEKGNSKVDAEALEGMEHPSGVKMKEYLKLTKDLSQLDTGEGSLIKNYREKSKTLTSRVDTNGTVTGRFTSSSINLNQIPAQEEFRRLFDAPEGWTFVGTDFDGQENVNLAEALFPFDGGRLNNIIVTGSKKEGTDLHSLNAKACGVSRDDGKALWFGFLYGSSSTLTGYTLLGDKEFTEYTEEEYRAADVKIQRRLKPINGEMYYPVKSGANATYVKYTPQLVKQAVFGKQVQEKLVQSTNGLADLIKHLGDIVKKEGGITTLAGRKVPVDSSHKCLNYFCQGQGAEAMKHYLRTIHKGFKEKGLVHGRDFIQQACIYDEVDLIVRDEFVDVVSEVLSESYLKVSKELGMTCEYTGEVLVGKDWYDCH